ncbi:unnamed protein product [Lactuca virosa]|uniref:Uncharacterized protein n=1 Tax=Lactuca virosa TaxID=75947 RepID=A0AAU9MIN8_9ASTR|nr:unnamed protein product [Lactuca virosa]
MSSKKQKRDSTSGASTRNCSIATSLVDSRPSPLRLEGLIILYLVHSTPLDQSLEDQMVELSCSRDEFSSVTLVHDVETYFEVEMAAMTLVRWGYA